MSNLVEMHQPKIGNLSAYQRFSQTTESMTGVKTMGALQPAIPGMAQQRFLMSKRANMVPPIDPDVKKKINENLNQSYQDVIAPGFLHAEFEGGVSAS